MLLPLLKIEYLFYCSIIAASLSYGQATYNQPDSILDVAAGRRTDANALWWGFNSINVTSNLQAALNSRATKLLIPNIGVPWIVDPLELSSNKEITLEPGVILQARKGSFLGVNDCLLKETDQYDITLIGYGAQAIMNQEDYTKSPYTPGEFRHCLYINGGANINIFGLRFAKSGGDGIFIDGNAPAGKRYCSYVHIKDVVCDSNYRQGISVCSAQNLLIESTVLSNTHGTAPMAGIDFEPDFFDDTLINCTLRNCKILNNRLGIVVQLQCFTTESHPISITVDSCKVQNNDICSIDIWGVNAPVPNVGFIILRNNQFIGEQYFYRMNGVHAVVIDSTKRDINPSPPGNLEAFLYGDQLSSKVLFQWTPLNGTAIYHFQLSQDSHFGLLSIPLDTYIPASTVKFGPLDNERTYYYRIQTISDSGVSEYTPVHSFIKSALKTIPINLELYQNYPNPFNPTTRIYYDLPIAGFTTLRIYNSLGQAVSTIVSQYMQPGRHTAEWDATGFASGIYFCNIQSGASTVTKKLVLIR
jgi:hypothetical protein